MRKRPFISVVLMGMLLTAAPLFAQIYKYTDETGQARWTDDFTQVPVNQRQAIKQFEEIEGDDPQVAERPDTIPANETQQAGDSEVTRDALLKEKAELENQYQHLQEERQQIEKLKSEAGGTASQKELNTRISDFNAKTDKYETQRKALSDKVNRFNNQQASQ